MNKHDLIKLAEELLKAEDLSKRSEDLLILKREYKFLALRDEETYYERQLTEQFNSLFEELAKREPKLNQSTYDEKKEIIELARKLLSRNGILKASRDLDKYSLDFKKAGRCSKEQDDELFAEFKAIKDEFYAKKQAYFEDLDKTNAERKAKKEDIISRAKELLNIKSIKESNEKMDALMEEWKAVGFAGKENDEVLWQTFSEVRKEFNAKKRERHEELIKIFEERALKKEEMIKTAKKLVADADFSDEEVKRVKRMRGEFEEIGFAGKDKDDDLYERFNAVIKQYFDEKKFYTF